MESPLPLACTSLVGRSIEIGLLPIEPPLSSVEIQGRWLPRRYWMCYPFLLWTHPLFECSLKITLGSLLASLECAPICRDSQEAIKSVHYELSASFYHRVYPGIESPESLLLLTPKLLQVSPPASFMTNFWPSAHLSSPLSIFRFDNLLSIAIYFFPQAFSLNMNCSFQFTPSYWHLFILLTKDIQNPGQGFLPWCSAFHQGNH